MKTLLKNAFYLDENFDVKYGNILIENETIREISKMELPADEVIDIKNNLLMPAFTDMHTHTAMSLLRSIDDNKNLSDWLNSIFKKEANLTKHDVYIGSKIGILNYIKNGITTFADMYYYPTETARASAELGVNSVIALGPIGNQDVCESQIENEIKEISNLKQDFYFACHSVYLRNKNDFELIERLAKKYKKIIYTHACETINEVETCKLNHNMTPVELLNSYGFFKQKNAFAHGVHLSDNDIKILKSSNTAIVSNPASNLKLGSGVCNLFKLKENKILSCLATDGACSNNRLDMFREMYLASSMEKFKLNKCDLLTSKEIIKMATVNGALAFNLKNLGLIKKGYQADLIELNLHSLNFIPHNNILNDIIYSAETEDIMMTMCKGKVLYKDNKFVNISNKELQKLFESAEEIIKKI